nr:MurR/RpiR family transcriptional regulator [Brachybacterium sacelli]
MSGVIVSIQTSIQAKLESYPPSMQRVASAILAHPHTVLQSTISELARECSTSETSVVRFCRSIGFSGFAPFKLELAAELATETAQFGPSEHGADISAEDSLAEAVVKVARSEVLGIQETMAQLDIDAIERIADRIRSCGKVLLFGVGASGAAPRDFAQKLLRIGVTALDFTDAHDALVSAALLGQDDVAVVFSHSGTTREAVAVLRAARNAGALTIAVTNAADPPLAAHAEEVLPTAVRETTFRSGAMASRIAQLTVVDYLFVGIARKDFDATVEALRTTYDTVSALRDDR